MYLTFSQLKMTFKSLINSASCYKNYIYNILTKSSLITSLKEKPIQNGQVTSIAGNLYCQATAKSCMFSFCQHFHKNKANFVSAKHTLVWFQETTFH